METERGDGTPRGELARIRRGREKQDDAVAERIAVAMLEACGEKGFRAVAVQDVIDRYGGNRVQFYRHFANKAEAYAAAYEREIEALRDRILAACGKSLAWRPGLRAALQELAAFLVERPPLARGLLIEVHVAAGPSLAKRAEVYEGLAETIDRARKEAGGADPPPPPLTAKFMLGAVDAAATAALARNDPAGFAAAVPELAHMIVAAYFGEAVAAEELEGDSGGSRRASRIASSPPR